VGGGKVGEIVHEGRRSIRQLARNTRTAQYHSATHAQHNIISRDAFVSAACSLARACCRAGESPQTRVTSDDVLTRAPLDGQNSATLVFLGALFFKVCICLYTRFRRGPQGRNSRRGTGNIIRGAFIKSWSDIRPQTITSCLYHNQTSGAYRPRKHARCSCFPC
jgi:hypothetical protein